MARLALFVMFVAILVATNSTAPVDENGRINIGVPILSQLERVLTAGKSIADATAELVKAAQKIGQQYRAIAYIEIHNYAKFGLAQGYFMLNLGTTEQSMPSFISPGHKEGFTATQNKPAKGVELAAAWKTELGQTVAFIAKAYQQVAWRPANKLGVSLKISTWNRDYDDWDSEVKQQDFKEVIQVMQCCDDTICIQGIMSSSHDTNITIKIFPKYVEDLAYLDISGPIDQRELDNILYIQDQCN